MNSKAHLWTKDFILVFISNLMLFLSFYMLVPVLPFYVMNNLGTSESIAGIVLSLYTIAALLIRPFSGYLVDTFNRKPLYLLCYLCFSILFAGYVVAFTLFIFIMLRIMHGFAFGISTVSGSTVAVDVMHSELRGKGIGYFGMGASIAMALGPMLGLWIHKQYSFNVLFLLAFATSIIGLITIFFITPIKKEHVSSSDKPILSLDRFILIKALPCTLSLFFIGYSYGTVVNYIGLYCSQSAGEAGLFFTVLAAGVIVARLFSSNQVNEGKVIQTVCIGIVLIIIGFVMFALSSNHLLFYMVALLVGAGVGYVSPSFQSMFINMAEHSQRGTANATYLSTWDLGIGIGTATGGMIIGKVGFSVLYAFCAGLNVLGLIYFATVGAGYFTKHKLR